MNAAELVVQKRNTAEFIKADSVDVRFKRVKYQPNNRGGWDRVGVGWTNLQRVRHQPPLLRGTYYTDQGQSIRSKDRLLMMPDGDVHVDDEFEMDGDWWKVVTILRRPYETIAQVELRTDG